LQDISSCNSATFSDVTIIIIKKGYLHHRMMKSGKDKEIKKFSFQRISPACLFAGKNNKPANDSSQKNEVIFL